MTDRHRFECRGCGAHVVVDSDVRDSILEEGCPLCDAAAAEGDFEHVDPREVNQTG